jgi:hypothetical protein
MYFHNTKCVLISTLIAGYLIACNQSAVNSSTGNSPQKNAPDSNIAVIYFDRGFTYSSIFDSTYTAATLTETEMQEIEKLFNKSIIDHNAQLNKE